MAMDPDGRPWREAYRRAGRLADRTVARLNEIIDDAVAKTDGHFAPTEATEAFADGLAEKDPLLFEWLLDSSAAQKIYRRRIKFPPIVLDSATMRLVDGRHRYLVAKELEVEKIPAIRKT
jgi:hypothetical protein